jgi:hypothetical protein
MDVSDVRRRLLVAMDKARKDAAERRVRNDAGARDYETFLSERAVPLFHQIASALAGEGHAFKVFTPAGAVRLASDRRPEDFIELTLDLESDRPQVLGQSSRGRGRRQIAIERPLRDGVPIAALTDEDVLSFVLEELIPIVIR